MYERERIMQLESEIERLKKIRCWHCVAYREQEIAKLKRKLKLQETI